MTTQIKLRRDTAANWVSANPVLALGEPGLETDTRQIKYGDGSTAWNSLLYSAGGQGTATNEITNSGYSVSVSDIGVVTMATARGNLEFGAQPEPGGPTHLHIMRPEGQESSTDLYFGDDFNYVKLPGNYGAGTLGVEIGSSIGSNVNVWRFGTNGTLNTPLMLPVTFIAVLDSEHMFSPNPAVALTDTPWQFEVQFQVGPDGTVQTMMDSPFPNPVNPGYDSGYTFIFTEADHGIPEYTFSISLNNVVLPGGAGWTANPAVSPPPLYPSTFASAGAVKLTASESTWTFGTDGNLHLPTGGDIKDSTGSSVLGSNDRLVNGVNSVVLNSDASTTFPGTLNVAGGDAPSITGPDGVKISATEGKQLMLDWQAAAVNPYPGSPQLSTTVALVNMDYNGVSIEVNNADGGGYWTFGPNGKLRLPIGGDIVDNTGASVLGGGGASTGNITFTDTTLTSTNGDVIITFDPVASPAVSFSFTSSGILNSPIINTNSINVAGAKHSTTQSTECLPNVDTVVFTGSSYGTATLKALFHVEGVETVDLESQSCEMMVAVMSPRVAGSVYGLAYTSSAPLATFTARWNSVSQLVEITCRPTSTTETVHVQTTTIELSILAP